MSDEFKVEIVEYPTAAFISQEEWNSTQRMIREMHQFCTTLNGVIESMGKSPMARMVPGMSQVTAAARGTDIGRRAANGG